MDVEAALAQAQAELEIIPQWAADEISSKADVKYLKQKDIDKEQSLVRHTLVARLNVWKRSIDNNASEYLHYGATTVDIWDTVLVLQIDELIHPVVEHTAPTQLFGVGVDRADADLHLATTGLDGASHDRPHPQGLPNLVGRLGAVLEFQCRLVCDHRQVI